jgi:hypothetical protein
VAAIWQLDWHWGVAASLAVGNAQQPMELILARALVLVLLPLCLLLWGVSSNIWPSPLVMPSDELSSYSFAAGTSLAGGLRDNDEGGGGRERWLLSCFEIACCVLYS